MRYKKIKSKISYKNPWFKIEDHTVIRPNGKKGIYSFLKKSSGVVIIALDDDKSIFFTKEYRYPINKKVWQLPAGSMEGKNILKEGKKELFEETGLKAKNIKKIGGFFIAPGHEDTFVHVLLATNLDKSKIGLDFKGGDEDISEIKNIKIAKVKNMTEKGEINCGISVAALNIFLCNKNY
ncbi:NUDIX hydrolase [Patescibacteria group bacterium]|nr:NUDIX hydrolase [Patescibacteria group bacterium]